MTVRMDGKGRVLGRAMRPVALVGAIALALGARALPWSLAGASLAFPVFVGLNPERFSPPTLPSSGSGMERAGTGRFASLAPLIDRSAPRAGEGAASGEGGAQARRPPPPSEPWLDPRPTGALPRPYRVRAMAGGAVLIVDGTGARVVRPGGVLPSGERLVRVEDGRLVTRPPTGASPAQGVRANVASKGEG